MKKALNYFMALLIFIMLIFGTSKFYQFTLGFQGVDYFENIRTKLRRLSSERLLQRADSVFYKMFSAQSVLCLDILIERNEVKAIPLFLRLLHSKNKGERKIAFRALSTIKDARAIEPLMNIILENKDKGDYIDALTTLSILQYEGVLPYVIQWTKESDAYANGSITMVKNFEKPELIQFIVCFVMATN